MKINRNSVAKALIVGTFLTVGGATQTTLSASTVTTTCTSPTISSSQTGTKHTLTTKSTTIRTGQQTTTQ